MREAASSLECETAARLRDEIKRLKLLDPPVIGSEGKAATEMGVTYAAETAAGGGGGGRLAAISC